MQLSAGNTLRAPFSNLQPGTLYTVELVTYSEDQPSETISIQHYTSMYLVTARVEDFPEKMLLNPDIAFLNSFNEACPEIFAFLYFWRHCNILCS